MLSWTERARRRGAINLPEFEDAMRARGFVEVMPTDRDALHEFTHPDTGDRHYAMACGDSYSRALARMVEALRLSQPVGAEP